MKTKSNILRQLILVGILCELPQAFAVQNLPTRTPALTSSLSQSALDKLTLSLVDRLPTDIEREFARQRGQHGAFDLANHLIRTKEFFDRQSLYWQSNLNQSPAWIWENHADAQGSKYFQQSTTSPLRSLYFFPPNDRGRSETLCSGVWTVVQDNKPALCGCDDTVDVLPHWDSSSSMRVCPVAKQEDVCGSVLQKCVPVDARVHAHIRNLEIDKESAGGRAISRILNDIALAQGRSVALSIVSQQKWSQLFENSRTALSRSSVELINKWATANPDSPTANLAAILRTREINESVKSFLLPPLAPTRTRGARMLSDSPAEELVVTPSLDARIMLQPLRQTQLGQNVWAWNAKLILTCQIPHFAPQAFQLPLPSPETARDGSYFCSSCHLSLDKFNAEIKSRKLSLASSKLVLSPGIGSAEKSCAVEHALQFLLGYKPTGEQLIKLRRQGSVFFQQNNENLAATIRDLALQIARYGGGE